jgi:pyruvate,orthophosphate dikinase
VTRKLVARGTGASPGVATGVIVFRAEDAVALATKGTSVIFVRTDTTPEDVPGLRVAAGILTTRGGITGDAAIVARTLGKPCIASCPGMHVDYTENKLTVWKDSEAHEGAEDIVLGFDDKITINGATGEVWVEA